MRSKEIDQTTILTLIVVSQDSFGEALEESSEMK